LLSARPSDAFLLWACTGRLRELLPELDALRGVSQLPAHRDDAFMHTLKVVDAIEPTPVRRWAALLHDIGKAATFIETPEGRSRFFDHHRIGAEMVPPIMSRFGEPPELIAHVQRLVQLHMRPISYTPEWSDAAVRRLIAEAEQGRGEQGWRDLMALARADLRGYLPEPIDRGLSVLDQLERRAARLLYGSSLPQGAGSEAGANTVAEEADAQPRSPLDGHELMALAGRPPGPWVGALKEYLRAQVEQGLLHPDDRQAARELALRWLDRLDPHT
jgi:poly(A) polymerase